MSTVSNDLLSVDHAQVGVLIGDALLAFQDGSGMREAFEKLDLLWARLAIHIRAEHLHLFPAVQKICEAEVPTGLSHIPERLLRLRRDHDYFMHELAQLIKRMRTATAENDHVIRHEARRIILEIRERLDEHNAIEENEIYPLALKFLPDANYEILIGSLKTELDNLPARFLRSDA